MYPGTQFNWIDQSFIQEETIETNNTAPLFMSVSSFDKGPEEFREVFGNQFYELYGNTNFFAHGQNSIQMANIINNGGRLFLKRVVAPDSALANLVIIAKVKAVQKEEQRMDDNGNLLYYTDDTLSEITTDKTEYKVMDKVYLDEDGNETTEVTDTPVNVASISYESKSFENVTADDDNLYASAYKLFKEKALNLLSTDSDEGVFPLFIISDNGRGASSKAVRVVPDYNVSRGSGYMFYNFEVLEGSTKDEAIMFTANPTVIYSNTSYRLSADSCKQIRAYMDEEVFDEFAKRVQDITGLDYDYIINNDVLFGKSAKGTNESTIVIDSEGVDLQATTGISLAGGNNGAFGDYPADKNNTEAYAAWAEAIRSVYAGEVTDEIYDVDQHKICAILDANFPNSVKEAIAELVVFRKDCMFFRDIGTGKYTFSEIRAAYNELPGLNREDRKFIADFATSYEIKDPNSYKNIEVTCLYDMASVLVNHFELNYNAPIAGVYNGFILQSAIKGTINYTPINTPKANMKQAMEDLHINYAIFEGDNCVMQSSYTAQDTLSQLSFVNNVIAIQTVMRAVRTSCPANRFSLSNGSDLTTYAKDVQNILDDFKDRFDILEFEYTANPLMAQQKIFYASIRFAFLNWAQSEVFDLYAINNE